MALSNMKLLLKEITEESVEQFSEMDYGMLMDWMYNGADTTIKELQALSVEEREDIVDFLGEFISYKELCVNGQQYILVHAGFENFSKEKELDEYSIDEVVWTRIDYDVPYFDDKIVVSGHMPTQIIAGNPKPGYIYKANNHIAIDCGACQLEGRLAAICLETGEEFYV